MINRLLNKSLTLFFRLGMTLLIIISGSHVVLASGPGHFQAAGQTATVLPVTYTISGNAGVAGATLSYTDGLPQSVTADGAGDYTLTVSDHWSGAVTPSASGVSFWPAQRSYNNVTSNPASQDYNTTPVTCVVSGNAGVAGATLSYVDGTPKTAMADSNGNYSFSVSYGWTGTVTPSAAGASFTPASHSYAGLTADQAGQNYASTLTLTSIGAQDGWVLESSENSSRGGWLNATDRTFRLGDDRSNRQYRALLSFDTSALPDTAVISSAVLKIKQSGLPVGHNPFSVLGRLLVDIRNGFFGSSSALQLGDFSAAPSAVNAAVFSRTPAGGWYKAVLSAGGLNNINRLGLTQLRLRFALDDNNNHVADYMSFLSGNASSGGRPVLVVTSTTVPTSVHMPLLSITLGTTNISSGITLDQGGDVDTRVDLKGSPAVETRTSGNGIALPSPDGNTIPDSYLQFKVDDRQLFAGQPTSHVRVEVDYFDQGSDTFMLQYDALALGGADGLFTSGGSVVKTNTNTFRTASFNLCDSNFANRDNGADFRISDNSDGAESIRAVRVIGMPSSGSQRINVDDFGANPYDTNPDSNAIQAALDSTCSGDTVVFTSGASNPAYKGYLIDKTLFLTGMTAKHSLTFTASDPGNHAQLHATADLKGFVVRLYARSWVNDPGNIDNIDFGYIDVDGGRDVRVCSGADGISDGNNDSWGSWLPECGSGDAGDPWCSPGNIALEGSLNAADVTQNYHNHPEWWTTGIVLHDVIDSQTECATALGFSSAAGIIQNVTIDTAGDHVHAAGCTLTDNDGDQGGWSDGITLVGPAQTVNENTITDPSDVGIVYFGGKDTLIANNTLQITKGNYGAFAGIAVHPWVFGDVSGDQIVENQVTSGGDANCGGLHAGINIGPQMWGGACVNSSTGAMFGNDAACVDEPDHSTVAACSGGQCQLWAYLPPSSTFTLKENTVSGAQINYLVDGFDILGQFIDQLNVSQTPQLSDWSAARTGCYGVTWGALDKVAHDMSLPGYTDLLIHCER